MDNLYFYFKFQLKMADMKQKIAGKLAKASYGARWILLTEFSPIRYTPYTSNLKCPKSP